VLPDYQALGPQSLAQFKAKRLDADSFGRPGTGAEKDRRRAGNTRSATRAAEHIGLSKLIRFEGRARKAGAVDDDRPRRLHRCRGQRERLSQRRLPVETGWHTRAFLAERLAGPAGKDFGPNAKYLTYNPDEAAKLLRAANYFGLEQDFSFALQGQFGNERQLSILQQMSNQGGHFKIKLNPVDYTTSHVPKYLQGKGKYEGITTVPLGGWSDWDIALWNTFTPTGRNDYVGHDTPSLKEIMVRHRRELDPKKRIAIAYEWQRAVAQEMVIVPAPGLATSFRMTWPWVGNGGWYEVAGGGVESNETTIHLWYNKARDTRGS
jgi:hypothetical protein